VSRSKCCVEVPLMNMLKYLRSFIGNEELHVKKYFVEFAPSTHIKVVIHISKCIKITGLQINLYLEQLWKFNYLQHFSSVENDTKRLTF
jgi:hypothetical protein